MIQACIVRNRPRPVGSGGRCHQGNGQYRPGFDSGLRSNPVCLAGIAAVREQRGGGKGGFGSNVLQFPGRKADRDTQCPCGSGRTYRRCCG